MNIKIFKYVNGKFVWWWTKHPIKNGKFFGYRKTKYAIDSNNFGVDPTIENFLNGKISLMALIQKSTT